MPVKKVISVFILISFFLSIFPSTLTFTEGCNYIMRAKRAKRRGNENDEREYLLKAYELFKKNRDIDSKFLQLYTGRLIGKDYDLTNIAKIILKENRPYYRNHIQGLTILDQTEKSDLEIYLKRIEEKIPFFNNLEPVKEIIYPYKGEDPAFSFSVNDSANISLIINHENKYSGYSVRGHNRISFRWQDHYLKKNSLDFKLTAENDFESIEIFKTILFDISMPNYLSFYNGEFKIKGRFFLPETRKKRKLKRGVLGLSLSFILVGIGAVIFSDDPWAVILGGGLGIGGGMVNLLSKSNYETYTADIPSNINRNKKLKRDIEKLKKEIRVKQKLKD